MFGELHVVKQAHRKVLARFLLRMRFLFWYLFGISIDWCSVPLVLLRVTIFFFWSSQQITGINFSYLKPS